MRAFKLGKKKEREQIKIIVVPRLTAPAKIPKKLFPKPNPPKNEKKFYLDLMGTPENSAL